jgi:acetylornithine/N-succinyldiaminopimelate aminotransferase
MNTRQLFLKHNAQTSPNPLAIEIDAAKDEFLFDVNGKKYIDIIGGISVCNVGHQNPEVNLAIETQLKKYLHVMVYGEVIQNPQTIYAKTLIDILPPSLNAVYFTNSGSEATEGAMKLAKRYTGKSKMISFKNSYHGSTQGALSVMGSEYWQQAFRPLLPNVYQFEFGSQEAIDNIDHQTACIILEPIQSEAGVFQAPKNWFLELRKKCDATNTLLILDEIQTGFGRTGPFFAFEELNIIPDILLLGKALGGGMPMGAFIADKKIMDAFTENPVLGHITTFGGHPLCCAAGNAATHFLKKYLAENKNVVLEKENLFLEKLKHIKINNITSCGLLMAIHFDNFDINKKIIDKCIENGVFTDWFLFASNCLRIAPPLTISIESIEEACAIILTSIDEVYTTLELKK